MPLLWRYLIFQFLKVALFCVAAFILILLTMRLDEIAHFASLGAPLSSILLFTFYQIPYILPIAIPISCLIASLLLVQRLSYTHELTALRACGFALKDILCPLLLIGAFLSLANFWIVSEVATQSHLATNTLKSEFRSINPLLLLNNKHLMRLRGIYFDALGPSRVGESASQVILAVPSKHNGRLNLMLANRLKSSPNDFIGEGVTLLTTIATEQEEEFDHLILENIERTVSSVQDFSRFLQKKVWSINNDYLKMSLLLARIKEQQQQIQQLKQHPDQSAQLKQLKEQLNRSLADIGRRISIGFAAFTFTLLGTAFGMHISRQRKNKSLYWVIGLTTFYLVSFFAAKSIDQKWGLALTFYLLPSFILIVSSLFVLNRLTKGIE